MTPLQPMPVVIQGALSLPMLGVMTAPRESMAQSGTGVVIVNGGAQYRAGAHRMFSSLAQYLAHKGHAVLRFDLPGHGDSPGEPVSFESTAPHIGAAIDALHQYHPDLQHTALLGLCDGASASLLYLHATPDPRVTHLLLLNPWVHSEATRARTQLKHYYRQRLLMPDFWKKLVSGGVGLSALRDLGLQAARALSTHDAQLAHPFQDRMASAWHLFGGHICLLLSENDLTAKEFREYVGSASQWRHWERHPHLKLHDLPQSDHTLSLPDAQRLLQKLATEVLPNTP